MAEDKNFSEITKGMKTVLNIWRQWYLTLGGKIQVFKSLIASEPVYIASMKSVLWIQYKHCIKTLYGMVGNLK